MSVLANRRRAYGALVMSGMKNQLAYLGSFMVKNLFLVVFIYIFQALWRKVYGTRAELGGVTLAQMVWYLTVTEGIALGRSSLWQTVQDEVRDGTVAYGLARPLPYPQMTMARFLGEGMVRLLPILAIGMAVAIPSVGILPAYFRGLPGALVLAVGALVLTAQAEMLLGLAAFSLEEVSPLFWIFQKIMFFLGGLFFPLDLYPVRLAEILKWSPFASFSYWPAWVAVQGGEGFLRGLLNMMIWILLGSLAVQGAYRRAIRSVQSQGG